MATFGEEARRLMAAAGLSLRELARRTHYDPAHLSRTLSGRKRASRELAEALDRELSAGGLLARLAAEQTRADVLTPDDRERLLLAARWPSRLDHAVIDSLAAVLAGQRRTEDSLGTSAVAPAVRAQLRVIEGLVIDARGPLRPALVDVAGQWAQYQGWLHTAVHRYADAGRWYSVALEWAAESGDDELTATVLSFKGYVAWLRGQVGATIGLAQAARRYPGIYAGQLAYDVLQEARGRAVLGETYAVDRLVAESDELVDRALHELDTAPPWHYYRSAASWDLERGRVFARLPERRGRAAELLTAGLEALPAEHRDAEWVAPYRRELAGCS